MSLEASSSSSTVVVAKADIFLSSTDASLSERDKAFLYVAAPRRLFSRVCSSFSFLRGSFGHFRFAAGEEKGGGDAARRVYVRTEQFRSS